MKTAIVGIDTGIIQSKGASMIRQILAKIKEAITFQNLTKADKKGAFPWNSRIRIRLSEHDELRMQVDLKSDFHHVGFKVDPDDGDLSAFVAFAPVAVWVTLRKREIVEAIAPKVIRGNQMRSEAREVRLSNYRGTILWSFWMDPHMYRSNEPKWRQWSFSWEDAIFGERVAERTAGPPECVNIPMPEGLYPAKSTIERIVFRRARGRTTVKTMASITMDPRAGDGLHPIPIPGKGENSYDIDEDALYSMSCEVPKNATHVDAIAEVVRSVLDTRWKYGGKDWRPEAKPNVVDAVMN